MCFVSIVLPLQNGDINSQHRRKTLVYVNSTNADGAYGLKLKVQLHNAIQIGFGGKPLADMDEKLIIGFLRTNASQYSLLLPDVICELMKN